MVGAAGILIAMVSGKGREAMSYAWIIDRDHLFEPKDVEWGGENEKGTTGPRSAPKEYLRLLLDGVRPGAEVPSMDGGGMVTVQEFKMFDDDGKLYYQGRYIGPDDDDMFGPLDDFGKPNAGAVDIQYWDAFAGQWESL